MTNKIFRPLILTLFSFVLALSLSSSVFGSVTITINNVNAAGVGFNDPTPVAPVGGNPGTTLGAQRLFAFTYAANIWGSTLTSSVPIVINAQMTGLSCTSTSAVLGSAGAVNSGRDFAGAPFSGTWYSIALANKLFGSDLDGANSDINANFNSNLGNVGCLDGSFFYLGVDSNHGTNIDFVEVLIHEMGHGLGFATITDASTGALNGGFPSIYDRFLMDGSSGKSWIQMTNGERAASGLNSHKLAWDGPLVQAAVPSVLSVGIPLLTINSPGAIVGPYDAGGASFGPAPTVGGVTANFLLANDGVGTVTDGCEAFPAAFFAGQIAVIDRGTCSFKTKTLNAQNASAVGVIIVNNAVGTPAPTLGDDATIVTPITIPTVSVTQSDGNLIKAQLPAPGVNGTISLDTSVRAGADKFGKALLFSPNPFQSGSSVSHWDTIAFPNQLMEPNINGDLTQSVTPPQDLTFAQLRDIGWVANALPSAIAKTTGDNQNTALNSTFAVPLSVTVSPAVSGLTITWTVNPGGSGQSAAFPSTSSRFAVSTTNALGVATAPPLTANGQPGQYIMNATVPGAGTATFNLQNDPVPQSGPSCFTDTTQGDFQGGVINNLDATTSPGNLTLSNLPAIDQQNTAGTTTGTGFGTPNWTGQTFIPAVTGNLTRVDVQLFCANGASPCTGPAGNLTLSVRNTAAGVPTGADLGGTATILGFTSNAGGTFTANFASPPALTAGTQYALVLRPVSNPAAGSYFWIRSSPSTYANGQRVTSTDSGGSWTTDVTRDFNFVAYMQTGFTTGDFISSLKDSNPPFGNTLWTTLSWNATVPANTTLQFQVAGSNSFTGPFNFVGPDGTPATFYTTSPGNLNQFFLKRYLKYKAYLATTNGTVTPTLADVTVCFNNPTTAANSDLRGRITAPDGSAVAGALMQLSGGATRTTITDSNGYYHFDNLPTGDFYTVAPSLTNYHFAPENRSFSLLSTRTDAVFTANRDAVDSGNAIDAAGFFVRQHYLDFLSREPDQGGFNFWIDQILSCGGDAACRERRTINVSAAYFLSIEFMNTGGLVDGLYRASYNRRPQYAEFMPDTAVVARNVVVGETGWPETLNNNKQAFVEAWIQRAEFQTAYGGLNNASYVDTLISHAGGYNGDREALVSGLNQNTLSRATVLRQIAENEGFAQTKRNGMFVMMQYFGYLRRDPDEAGFNFWLGKLNQHGGNFEQAEMVKSFLVSGEYRDRFRQ